MKMRAMAVIFLLCATDTGVATQRPPGPPKVQAVAIDYSPWSGLWVVQGLSGGSRAPRCPGINVGYFAILTSDLCAADWWSQPRQQVTFRHAITSKGFAPINVARGARRGEEAAWGTRTWAILETGASGGHFGSRSLDVQPVDTQQYHFVGFSPKYKGGKELGMQPDCRLFRISPGQYTSTCGADMNPGFLILGPKSEDGIVVGVATVRSKAKVNGQWVQTIDVATSRTWGSTVRDLSVDQAARQSAAIRSGNGVNQSGTGLVGAGRGNSATAQPKPATQPVSRPGSGTSPSGASPTVPTVQPAQPVPQNNPTLLPGPATGSGPNLPPCGPAYPVTPRRWERFPIKVYFEIPELQRRGYSPQRVSELVSLFTKGLGSWSAATGGTIGTIVQVTNYTEADLNIVFRNGTGNTVWDTTEGDFIRHATILWDVNRWEGFGTERNHRHVNGMAHEMGHVLGIGAHPTLPGSLMIEAEEQLRYEGPQPLDVESIRKKYGKCGDTGTQTRPTVPAPPRPTSVPAAAGAANAEIAGSWTCRVDSVGMDFFILNQDGTVNFPTSPRDSRWTASGATVRFEQLDRDTTFYVKRVFQLTYANGQLRGTRTETPGSLNPSRDPIVSQYTCRRE